jgi:hypothetical protein
MIAVYDQRHNDSSNAGMTTLVTIAATRSCAYSVLITRISTENVDFAQSPKCHQKERGKSAALLICPQSIVFVLRIAFATSRLERELSGLRRRTKAAASGGSCAPHLPQERPSGAAANR